MVLATLGNGERLARRDGGAPGTGDVSCLI